MGFLGTNVSIALAQLTVAKWKLRMYGIDMFDLSDAWQPIGFFLQNNYSKGWKKNNLNILFCCFSGTVIKNINSTCALVDFSNGESCDVPVKFTIPVGGAMPCPHLQVKNCIFSLLQICILYLVYLLRPRINYRF